MHYYSSGTRRGTRERIGSYIPLPLFYCDTPGEEWSHLEEVEEEEEEEADGLREREDSASEIHEEVNRQSTVCMH